MILAIIKQSESIVIEMEMEELPILIALILKNALLTWLKIVLLVIMLRIMVARAIEIN